MKNAKQISGTAVEEIRRQLAFIENPAERLRLLFQKNLKADALTELNALVDKGIFFENPSRGHGIQIDPFKFDRSEKADSIVYSLDQSCFFTISGIAKFFGWKERQTRAFTDRLLAKMIEFDPKELRTIATWCGSWEINATRRTFEQYRPKDKKFADRIERWILLAYFYDGPYFTNGLGDEWYAKWLGVTIPRSTFTHHDEPGAVEERVDHNAMKYRALGKRLQQLGMSREEVQETFYTWIEKFKKSGLDLYYMAAVLESGILSRGEDNIRLTKLMCELTDTVLQSYMGYVGTVIANSGMKFDPTLRTKLIGWLAEKLAEGKIAYAYQINYLMGEAFFGKYLKRDTEVKLDECAALAFDKAVTAGNFGIAAAIAQQFGEEACFSEDFLVKQAQARLRRGWHKLSRQLMDERKTQIRECVGIAHAANQPIRLEYNCCFLRPY